MTDIIHLNIVSAQAEIFSGEATMVHVTGEEGEMGIAYGHTPLLTRLKPGQIAVSVLGGEQQLFFVSGGMLEVQPEEVTILADTVLRAEDLDEAAAEEAQQLAQGVLKKRATEKQPFDEVMSELAEATAKLRVIRELKRLRRC